MFESWITFAKFLLPILAGQLLFIVLFRVLYLWQNRSSRTTRNVWFASMYIFLFGVCAARAFNSSLSFLVSFYFGLVLALFPCVWYEGRNTIEYLMTKNTKFIANEAGAQLMTLDKLASDDVHAVLDATPVEDSGHVALEATPVKHEGG